MAVLYSDLYQFYSAGYGRGGSSYDSERSGGGEENGAGYRRHRGAPAPETENTNISFVPKMSNDQPDHILEQNHLIKC